MNNLQEFLKSRYERSQLCELAILLGCAKTTLFEWYEGRTPGFKNLVYVKKLADLNGMSLDQLLFQGAQLQTEHIATQTFKDGGHKYSIQIKRIGE